MRWSKGGMTSCQSTRKSRKCHKRFNASRTKKICRRKVPLHKKRYGSPVAVAPVLLPYAGAPFTR